MDQQNFMAASDKWTGTSQTYTRSVTPTVPQGCVQCYQSVQHAGATMDHTDHRPSPAHHYNDEICDVRDGFPNKIFNSEKRMSCSHSSTLLVTPTASPEHHAGRTFDARPARTTNQHGSARHKKNDINNVKDENANQQNFGSDRHKSNAHTSSLPVTPTAPPGCVDSNDFAKRVAVPFDAWPSKYVQHGSASTRQHNDEIYDARSASDEVNMRIQIDQGSSSQQQEAGKPSVITISDETNEKFVIGEQTLVKIPDAAVHLIDDRESVLLSEGNFSLSHMMSKGSRTVTIAKVGEELKWPVVQKSFTVKLDRTHYIFRVDVPIDMDDEDNFKNSHAGSKVDILNYGLTLPEPSTDEENVVLEKLDDLLDLYSMFSVPVLAHKGDVKEGTVTLGIPQGDDHGKVVSEAVVAVDGTMLPHEKISAAPWTEMAPDVNEYDSKIARSVATGTGDVIRNIFGLCDSTMVQLDSAHGYMKWRLKPKKRDSKISPNVIKALHSVAKVTAKLDKVTAGAVENIIQISDRITKAVVHSRPGQKVFKSTPGQLYLVSEEAFDSIFDAVEKAGKDVLVQSSFITTDFVNYRYGEAAKQLTDETLKSLGHITSVLWSVGKLQKVVNFEVGTSSTDN